MEATLTFASSTSDLRSTFKNVYPTAQTIQKHEHETTQTANSHETYSYFNYQYKIGDSQNKRGAIKKEGIK